MPTTTSNGGAPDPAVTVVVATRDRPALLAEALAAIRRSLREEDRLVVVDSASRDPHVRDVAESSGATVLRCDLPGACRARNMGLAAASTPVVAFTDDDCLPAPDWVPAVSAAFAAHPDVAFVTGRVSVDEPISGRMQLGLSIHDVAVPAAIDAGSDVSKIGHGANMAWRRARPPGAGWLRRGTRARDPAAGGGGSRSVLAGPAGRNDRRVRPSGRRAASAVARAARPAGHCARLWSRSRRVGREAVARGTFGRSPTIGWHRCRGGPACVAPPGSWPGVRAWCRWPGVPATVRDGRALGRRQARRFPARRRAGAGMADSRPVITGRRCSAPASPQRRTSPGRRVRIRPDTGSGA